MRNYLAPIFAYFLASCSSAGTDKSNDPQEECISGTITEEIPEWDFLPLIGLMPPDITHNYRIELDDGTVKVGQASLYNTTLDNLLAPGMHVTICIPKGSGYTPYTRWDGSMSSSFTFGERHIREARRPSKCAEP